MITYSFYDFEVSEAMLRFVDTKFDDFCRRNIEEDLSVAEYCLDHLERFKKFCITQYGFDVYLPFDWVD